MATVHDQSSGAWMTIHTSAIQEALERVANVETPDDVVLSLYMESEHEFND